MNNFNDFVKYDKKWILLCIADDVVYIDGERCISGKEEVRKRYPHDIECSKKVIPKTRIDELYKKHGDKK